MKEKHLLAALLSLKVRGSPGRESLITSKKLETFMLRPWGNERKEELRCFRRGHQQG